LQVFLLLEPALNAKLCKDRDHLPDGNSRQLGRMVELASQVTPTMDGVRRTIRAFSSLDRNGRWTEIPTHAVVSSGTQLTQARLTADSVKSLTLRSVIDAVNPSEESPEDALDGDGPGATEPEGRSRLVDNQNL
jgi:hypothetical protein